MSNLSYLTQKLINQYQGWYQSTLPKEGLLTIKVDEVASKVASFYEKIREVVDWREKHLMRRIAIERILKRRILLRVDGQDVAEPFVLELIRGGHFPNDRIERSKIKDAQKVLSKYTFILNNAPPLPKDRTKSEFYSLILDSAACEIEETLDPAFYRKENALIEYMETIMRERMKIGKRALAVKEISEEEKNMQIYIAVQQALFKLDSPTIIYNLLKRRYSDWSDLSSDKLTEITQNIYLIWENFEQDLSHFLADKFYKICERYDTAYLLLGDIISENPMAAEGKVSDPKTLEKMIKKVYGGRLRTLRSRLGRSALYSTLSIFLTNVFSLYILEYPFAKYVMGHIHILAAVMDVAGPTFLMFLMVITIRLPKERNLRSVIEEVKKIAYQNGGKDIYEVDLYPKRPILLKILFGFLYSLCFCLCFGLIIWALYKLEYPPLSYLLLIMFTSLIAFAGAQIRQRSRELHVTERKGGLFQTLLDIFAIPFIRAGKWFSSRWKKINIIGVVFALLIDTPFLLFVEFLEQWRYFVKEKKEDIR